MGCSSCSFVSKCRKAVMEEMRTLEMNGTWDMVSLPKRKTIVGCKWVFTIKYKPDGSKEMYKVTAKGFI